MPGGRSSIMLLCLFCPKEDVSAYTVPSTLDGDDEDWIPKRQDRNIKDQVPII